MQCNRAVFRGKTAGYPRPEMESQHVISHDEF
jgi:hypothetical protein